MISKGESPSPGSPPIVPRMPDILCINAILCFVGKGMKMHQTASQKHLKKNAVGLLYMDDESSGGKKSKNEPVISEHMLHNG